MKIKRRLLFTFLIVALTGSAVLATGISAYFGADSIKDRLGSTLNANDYHNYKTKLEFFHNSDPTDPKISGGRLADNTVQPLHSLVNNIHKYQLAGLDGGTLYVRVWKDAPSGNRQGNYYGVVSHGVAAGSTTPYDWSVSVATDHKADLPYEPTIGTVSESMVRTGNDLKLKLVVPVSYNKNPSGGQGIIEAQNFSVLVTYPDNSTEIKPGPSITLSDTPAGTYKFKPTATNWYGSTDGDEAVYSTLGVSGVGPDSAVYNFIKQTDGLGVNVFPIAYSNVLTPSINTVKDLVEAINDQAGEPVVTSIGMWDPVTQTPQGYAVEIDTNTQTVTGYVASSGIDSDPANVSLQKDMVYQISVTKTASFGVTGIR